MRKHEIEHWVLKIIERLQSGQRIEDDRVELKSSWIPAQKAARRLAGHANQASGGPILWIVGIDEAQAVVVGAPPQDLASWFAQVIAEFDGGYPHLTHIEVATRAPDGTTTVVSAMLFETDRAPFVVRNPGFGRQDCGPVSLEVPWREGTRTRTATRSDLVRILSPLQIIPDIDVLQADASASVAERNQDRVHWNIQMHLYSKSHVGESLVIPFHECEAQIHVLGTDTVLDVPSVRLKAPSSAMRPRYVSQMGPETPASLTIQETSDEIILSGPGKVLLTATADTPQVGEFANTSLGITVALRFVGIDMPKTIQATLGEYRFQEPNVHRWRQSPA